MPPLEKLFRGILKFQSTVKGDYMKSINNVGKLAVSNTLLFFLKHPGTNHLTTIIALD